MRTLNYTKNRGLNGSMRIFTLLPMRVPCGHQTKGHFHRSLASVCSATNSGSTSATESGEDKKGPTPPDALQQLNVKEDDKGKLPEGPITRLIALLGKYEATRWLAGLAERFITAGMPQAGDKVTMKIARGVFLIAVFFAATVVRQQPASIKPREVLYSQFVTLLEEGKVQTSRLESGTSRVYFDVKQPSAETVTASTTATSSAAAATPSSMEETRALSSGATATTTATATSSAVNHKFQRQFFIKLADKNDTPLIQKIVACGVEFSVVKASFQGVLYNILLSAVAVWLPLFPLIFLVKRILEERSGNSKKKRTANPESITTTFDDVAGVDSAKLELAEVVSLMKAAKKENKSKLKVKVPSGVLLCGPPGTGKTLLAKAVAGEAGIPFIALSASEFVEMYVGRGAARIRELFAEARKLSPCVVFIDELDAVGSKRGMGYNDERDQTLNQLLTELDGFEGRPGVLFLAATNRIDVLDPALLRPGRLSRKVVVPLPDELGRKDILRVHLRGVPLSTDEEDSETVSRLSKVTGGFSGAELANVVNEASLLAARKSQDFVTFRELLEGVQRTRYGVNGQTPMAGSLQQSFNNWLMNIATDPANSRKAKNLVL